MKNIFTKFISALAISGAMLFFAGCVEEMPSVNEELLLDRCLTPTEFTASVDKTDGVTVNFKWKGSKGAKNYVIEVYEVAEDMTPEAFFVEGMTAEPAQTLTSEGTSDKMVLNSDKFYLARIKATTDTDIDDSRWLAYDKVLGTYEVKSDLMPVLVSRTSTGITVKWTQTDEDLIDHIRVTPNPDPEDTKEYKLVPVDGVVKDAEKTVTVEGLNPSVKYTLAIHYKSANRGEVYAWTRPSLDNPVQAATSEALKQALVDGAAVIELTNVETPYEIYGEVKEGLMEGLALTYGADKSLSIYGKSAEDGKKPTVVGAFKLPEMLNVHVEDVKFVGTNADGAIAERIFDVTGAKLESLQMINCEVSDYKCGILYCNAAGELGKAKFDNINVWDVIGDGGDFIDIRKANVGDITVTNSTFHNSIRCFLRIDKTLTVGNIKIEHNTFNNVAGQFGNGKGIFYLRAASYESITVAKNLFLNIVHSDPTKAVFYTTDTSGENAGLLTQFKENYFYKLSTGFWKKETVDGTTLNADGKGHVTQTQGLAGDGMILSADPCENSVEGIFYLKTSSEAFEKGIGDPRWLENYVPVVEPTTLETPVDYGKVWNLTDTKMFGKTVKKDLIRDGLRFFSKSVVFNVLETGLEFKDAGVVKATGVPEDGAIAFRVKGPGSVILSVEKSRTGDLNDHLTVALGDVAGTSAEIKGSAFVGAKKVKIAFPNLAADEEKLVYLYGCGPVVLTAMQWTNDVNVGASPILDTPEPELDQAEVDDTYTGKVNLTWPAVSSAASYKIVMVNQYLGEDGKIEETVTGPAYELPLASMATGKWSITVQALPDPSDLSKEPSELPQEPLVFNYKETLKPVSASNPTAWGQAHFGTLINTWGANTEVTESFVFENLSYISGGGKFKFNTDESIILDEVTENRARVQLGSGGTFGTKCCIQLIVPGPGTLTVYAATSSNNNVRGVEVAAAGTSVGYVESGTSNKDAKKMEFDCTSLTGQTTLDIIRYNSGVNIYQIIWTPSGFDPNAGIPFDETAINEAYMTDYTNVTKYPAGEFVAKGESKTVDKITYVAHKDKQIDSEPNKPRIKLNKTATLGDDGIPTGAYASFRITKPGTITHKIIAGSDTYDGRKVHVLLVKKVDGANQTVVLYEANADLSSGDSARTIEVTKEHLSGTKESVTIYFYSTDGGGSCNLYQLGFTPAAE